MRAGDVAAEMHAVNDELCRRCGRRYGRHLADGPASCPVGRTHFLASGVFKTMQVEWEENLRDGR